MNIFGETFSVPFAAVYEYVRATVDVGRQKLRIYLDHALIDERNHQLR
jgi:hypothetical protein